MGEKQEQKSSDKSAVRRSLRIYQFHGKKAAFTERTGDP